MGGMLSGSIFKMTVFKRAIIVLFLFLKKFFVYAMSIKSRTIAVNHKNLPVLLNLLSSTGLV